MDPVLIAEEIVPNVRLPSEATGPAQVMEETCPTTDALVAQTKSCLDQETYKQYKRRNVDSLKTIKQGFVVGNSKKKDMVSVTTNAIERQPLRLSVVGPDLAHHEQ